MDIPSHLRAGCESYPDLGRWHRAELGRALRRLGLSYGEIMSLIPVPKGTLAGWCREIRLTSDQIAGIKRRRGPRAGPRDTQWRRRLEVEEIQSEARTEALGLMNDPLWVGGTVMYWAEGGKTNRMLALSNADPSALRLFLVWVRHHHDPEAEFVLALHLHEGNSDSLARRYWSDELGIDAFHKTYTKPRGTGHRTNKLAYGICRIVMRRSTDAWLRTMTWIEVLQARFGPIANLSAGSLAQLARATDS